MKTTAQVEFYVPEVGDEVLVAFEQGVFDRPFVLGGLWNGVNSVPPEASGVAANERPKARIWRSIGGHSLAMLDTIERGSGELVRANQLLAAG